ncbi:unnamed protein product, partial [Meganyctiphanes norvegica]
IFGEEHFSGRVFSFSGGMHFSGGAFFWECFFFLEADSFLEEDMVLETLFILLNFSQFYYNVSSMISYHYLEELIFLGGCVSGYCMFIVNMGSGFPFLQDLQDTTGLWHFWDLLVPLYQAIFFNLLYMMPHVIKSHDCKIFD